jgi:hypothetical protein
MGFEPTTLGTTIQCSNLLSYNHHFTSLFLPNIAIGVKNAVQIYYFISFTKQPSSFLKHFLIFCKIMLKTCNKYFSFLFYICCLLYNLKY